MADFSEFRRHWRPLLGGFIGMGSALSLNSYILSIFAPYFMKDLGWSLSQWASLGTVQMLIVFCTPVAGRLADHFGVRRVAAVGALTFPMFLLAIAAMDGSIQTYLVIYIAQTVICSTTTATVYSRVVAGAYSARRGLALGIVGSSPPLVAALFSGPISGFVEAEGWRAGYMLVAAFCAVCAVVTLLLLPSREAEAANDKASGVTAREGVYRAVFTSPVFWIMLAATFLVNLPFTLATTQLKTVVLAQGLPASAAAVLVSVFAISSIVGRVLSGVALDYLPAHLIAAIGFGLPVLGLGLLASPLDSFAAVAVALALIGISFGGEGDIIPYLVTRYFGIAIYSTVLGLLSAVMGLAMGGGNILLAMTGSFDVFLWIAAATAFIGSLLFLALGNARFKAAVP
jgi:MFS family permease